MSGFDRYAVTGELARSREDLVSSGTGRKPHGLPDGRGAAAMAETILVVDDDADVRTIARTALLRLGYAVLETGDPHEALRIAKAQPVDLLLTDVIMPLMNGMELADRIQTVNTRTKVIVMSGYPDRGNPGLWTRVRPQALQHRGARKTGSGDPGPSLGVRPNATRTRPPRRHGSQERQLSTPFVPGSAIRAGRATSRGRCVCRRCHRPSRRL